MDTPEGFISAVILAIIGGGVGTKLLDFLRESIKGRTDRRRAEVDNMAKLVTEEKLKAVTAENSRDEALRRARNAEEVVAELRLMLLNTGKYSREQIPDIDDD